MTDEDYEDWYDDIERTPEDQRREAILALVREALGVRLDPPITVRTLSIDFEARTVSIDGRVYGPIETRGFTVPLVESTHVIMPTRSTEPW